MNHSLTLLGDRIELILPSDCLFDPVPGRDDDALWQGSTDDYRAWAARWARPAWDDVSWEDAGAGGRAMPRIRRALKL